MAARGLDLSRLTRDYGDIAAEVAACRQAAALFDFTFMHRARVAGPGAAALVQRLTPRPLAALPPGRIAYALRLDEAGYAVADLTLWHLDAETFDVFSGRPDEIAWLAASATEAARVRDLTPDTAIFAVQGPHALRALAGLIDAGSLARLRELAYFAHAEATIAGVCCRIGRLGYTGERGFEIVAPRPSADALWAALAERARPAGFAAADILRIEAGFILFSNELGVRVTPQELGLARFAPHAVALAAYPAPRVRLIAVAAQAAAAPVLYQPSGDPRFPPEPGTVLVTSACRSAAAGGVLGLGYVAAADMAPLHDPSGRFSAIREVSLPFVDPEKRRIRGDWDTALRPVASAKLTPRGGA